MNKYLVSIITPTHNSEKFVSETISCILDQTYLNWELLITDDCSTDDTCSIVESYVARDSRIKLFRLEKNSGAGEARNNSIEKAQGRFIAFCDSDDLWYPEKLEKQIAFMLGKSISFSYTNYEEISEEGDFLRKVYAPDKVYYKQMLKVDYVGFLTAIYDVQHFGKVYMSPQRKRQDWILLLTILKKVDFGYGLLEILASYRIRENSISSNKFILYKYIWKVYRVSQNFSRIKSSYYLFLYTVSYFYKRSKSKV